MPLFMSDEELQLLEGVTLAIAQRADAAIRELRLQLDTVRAEANDASIASEHTRALLEQRYASLSAEFDRSQAEAAELTAAAKRRAAELASSQAERHQLRIELASTQAEIHQLRIQAVNLTETSAGKDARIQEVEAMFTHCQAICNRITQEKELLGKHNLWLDEELKAKVKNLTELRKTNMDEEARMSARIAELEREISESSSSSRRSKERISELEQRVSYMEKETVNLKQKLAKCKLDLENTRALMWKHNEVKSLQNSVQIQARLIEKLRKSNIQLREENMHNFKECQKFREEAQKAKMESERLQNLVLEQQLHTETSKREVEMQKTEIANLNQRISELIENSKDMEECSSPVHDGAATQTPVVEIARMDAYTSAAGRPVDCQPRQARTRIQAADGIEIIKRCLFDDAPREDD